MAIVALGAVAAVAAMWRQWRGAVREAGEAREALGAARARMEEEERRGAETRDELVAVREAEGAAREALGEAQVRNAGLVEKLRGAEEARGELRQTRERLAEAQSEVARLAEELDGERRLSGEKLKTFTEARTEMEDRFKTLAQNVLEEKSQKFGEDSRQALAPLLQPLRDNLGQFRVRLEEMQKDNIEERATLRGYIGQLQKDTVRISADATELADALKGSGKVQGDWGELMLETLLENSGLKKDENYQVQVALRNEEGSLRRPDAVIKLPDGKHLVIDAKVSLSAYKEYSAAADAAGRAAAIKAHLQSVRSHVARLYEANYSALPKLESPDFVLMFMPIEPAYILALQEDNKLFSEAYKKNVVLVGPATLLPVLRTVANIWRLEKQQQNAQEIAEYGGRLYDKFVGFKDDMDKIGESLGRVQKVYDEANKKLSAGRGNLVGQAQRLREMGVSSQKQLPREALAMAAEE